MGCRVERWVRLVSPEEKAYKKWLILPVFSVCIGVVRDSKIIFYCFVVVADVLYLFFTWGCRSSSHR